MIVHGIRLYRSLGPAINRALRRLQTAHSDKGISFSIVVYPFDPFARWTILAEFPDGKIAYIGAGKLP